MSSLKVYLNYAGLVSLYFKLDLMNAILDK